MSNTLVEIKNLVKSYTRGDQDVPVLRDITLNIELGDFISLMGPSGSGKSTLLNLIAGIDKPTGGMLRIDGEDISQLSEGELADWRASNIGFIFQFYNLMPVLTAYENVELPMIFAGTPQKDRKETVTRLLTRVGLGDRMDHKPTELSGGEMQRIEARR